MDSLHYLVRIDFKKEIQKTKVQERVKYRKISICGDVKTVRNTKQISEKYQK